MIHIDCPACGQGEHVFRVVMDSDGDPGVIGGTRSWASAEFEDQTCACVLSVEQETKVQEEADERAGRGDDLYDPC